MSCTICGEEENTAGACKCSPPPKDYPMGGPIRDAQPGPTPSPPAELLYTFDRTEEIARQLKRIADALENIGRAATKL